MSIYKKLFQVKKEIGTLTKDSKNPFFKSDYLSLNGLLVEVERVLATHNLLLLQPIEDGKVVTEIVDIESEESVVSEITLPTLNDPQKLGSAITYFRRYTLQSLLSLQAEDDDGNRASKPTLTNNQMLQTLKGTPAQIKAVLEKFDMTNAQRQQLKTLL